MKISFFYKIILKHKIVFLIISGAILVIIFLLNQMCVEKKSNSVSAIQESLSAPKISIVVPVYKVEPWLRECMDSLINQTLKDIEVICVNDGSPDNCPSILKEYAEKDNRVIVINQKNAGVQMARNKGLEQARGEYITFVDSDDYLQLNAYEVAYEFAKKDDVDILQFDYRRFDDGKDDHKIDNNLVDRKVLTKKQYWEIKLGACIWDKLIKRNIIKKDNIKFAPEIKPADDFCFSFMALSRAEKIKVIPARFYNYRIRDGAITNMKPRDKFINSYKLIKLICDDLRNYGYLAGIEDLVLSKLIIWSFRYNETCLEYAEEVLKSFGQDVYNPKIVSQCSDYIQSKIKELEGALISSKQHT